jgi:hypothetical protein
VFFISTISGCTLLFVQKGGTRISKIPDAAVRNAPSLQATLENGDSDLHYQTAKGDTLDQSFEAQDGFQGRPNCSRAPKSAVPFHEE